MNKGKQLSNKQIERRFETFKTAVAIFIALAIALLVISLVSEAPMEAIQAFIVGPLQKKSRLGNIVEMMTPLIFTGTAICVMYQANQFNMIGEGAFLLAANMTTYFVLTFSNMNGLGLKVGGILVGVVVGACAALIPAALKAKWKANEVVSSIMLNYILLQLANYILYYQMKDTKAGLQASYKLPPQSQLTKFISGTRIHTGIIIALVVVVAAYIFIYKTKWGYEIRMVGSNENFAKYSGINVIGVAVMAQVIGGAIAGMGGSIEQLGMYNRYVWYGKSPGYGWDGIMVGILAKNNPLYVPLAAFFLAYLRIGADAMNRFSDVPVEFINIVQAIVIMLIAAQMFMSKYKHKLIVTNAKKQLEAKEDK
ncbi:MAG: ABC transporter permease [Oscillospiraceae bacterium]